MIEEEKEKKGRRESIFFFKQKTAYEIKECDWSSDVCSSDLYGHSNLGTGVFGLSGSEFGVYGSTSSTYGVRGESAGSGAGNAGIFGTSTSATGVAGKSVKEYGLFGSSTSSAGVYGSSSATYGVHGVTTGISESNAGVFGSSESATGVYGSSASGYGVYGLGRLCGVLGKSDSFGVWGSSGSGWGVYGESQSSYGVFAHSSNSYGIRAETGLVSNSYGVYTPDYMYALGYKPFTGIHSALNKQVGDVKDKFSLGDVVIMTGTTEEIEKCISMKEKDDSEECERMTDDCFITCEDGFQTTRRSEIAHTIKPRDSRVCGVVGSINPDNSDISYNALGDGLCNVCYEGGPIEPGDLLTSSSRKGYAMKQDDDIVHSYTLAKARESINGKEGIISVYYYAG